MEAIFYQFFDISRNSEISNKYIIKKINVLNKKFFNF